MPINYLSKTIILVFEDFHATRIKNRLLENKELVRACEKKGLSLPSNFARAEEFYFDITTSWMEVCIVNDTLYRTVNDEPKP